MGARRGVRWFYFLLIMLAVGALGVAGVAWWIGGELIASTNHKVTMPADFPAETVSIPGNGHAIAGSWRDFGGDSPVVLLLHGVRADRASMVPQARQLVDAGYSVLLIDLQAHGETPGDRITFGWRESDDVRTARDWIRAKAPGRKIGVIGQSLGGAAVLLGKQPVGFDAVVLESVYPRIDRAVENRIRMRLGRAAPLLTPLLLAQLKPRLGVGATDLEPVRHIAELGAPVLVAGGERDEHTTEEETRDLYDESGKKDSQLWIAEGAAHEDLALYDERSYLQNVVGFLHEHLGEPKDLDTMRRVVAARVAAGPKGSREPSAAVEFFAKGLHPALTLELKLFRLQRQCKRNFPDRCRLKNDPPESVMEGMFKFGPPFEGVMASATVPDFKSFDALERETAEVEKAFQAEAAAYDRQMMVRLAAVVSACPSEDRAEVANSLNRIVRIYYRRIEPLPQEEFSALVDTFNNDGAHLGERLSEQWLGTTCKSAVSLRDQLVGAYESKVEPFAGKDWRKMKPIRRHLTGVWEIAFVLARDVGPTLDVRLMNLRYEMSDEPGS